MSTEPAPYAGKALAGRRGIAVAWLSSTVFLIACEGAGPPGALLVERDSAGIRIVETRAAERRQAPWTLAEAADWGVGEVEGDPRYLLSGVEGAMRLADGRIAVANRGTNELRFYGPDGSFERSAGGSGEGPGEFEFLRALEPCHPEGFIAFDLNWQMNVYSADGTFIEKTTLRTPSGVTPYEVACDRDGHVLMIGWGSELTDGPREGFYRALDRLLLTTQDGEVVTDFGTVLASERIGSRFGSRPHPAGRATVFGIHDETVFVGTGERFEVEVRALDGSLRALLRGPEIRLAVTDSVKRDVLEEMLESASPERHETIRSQVADWGWPESVPAYTAMVIDAEGVVWLRAFTARSTEPESWSLVDREAGYLGDITLPPRRTLLEAGGEYVLLLATDELDVERVEKFPLLRRAVGPSSP